MERSSDEELKQKYISWKKLDKTQNYLIYIGWSFIILTHLIVAISSLITGKIESDNILYTLIAIIISFSIGIFLAIFGFTYSFKKKKISIKINSEYIIKDINKKEKPEWVTYYCNKITKLKKRCLLLTVIFISVMVISIIGFSLVVIKNNEEGIPVLGVILLISMLLSFVGSLFSTILLPYTKIEFYNIDGYIVLFYYGFSNLLIIENEIKYKSIIPGPFQVLLPNNNLLVFIPDKYTPTALIVRHQYLEYIGMNSNDFSLPDIKTK